MRPLFSISIVGVLLILKFTLNLKKNYEAYFNHYSVTYLHE
jgi:hypothetical protein